jgi:DNA-binding response OmpR family regulator
MPNPGEVRLMVVEDEYLIAAGLEALLQAAGYTVLGPFPTVAEATTAAAGKPAADLALLDVNLSGKLVYPVADALSSQHVPFIFLSGCDGGDLPLRFAGTPLLVKPFSPEKLLQAVRLALKKVSLQAMPSSQMH